MSEMGAWHVVIQSTSLKKLLMVFGKKIKMKSENSKLIKAFGSLNKI